MSSQHPIPAEHHIPAEDVLALIKAGNVGSEAVGHLLREGVSNVVSDSLEITGLVFPSHFRLLANLSITGDLVFKDVIIEGDLDLSGLDIDGQVVFDDLSVGGNVLCDDFWPTNVVIRKIEVKGRFRFHLVSEMKAHLNA